MRLFGSQSARTIPISIFWKVLGSLQKTFSDWVQRDRAIRHLIPEGMPGAGILHGRQNIAKTLTYRAVRNLDFNTERNSRRAERRLLAMNVIGDGHG